MAVVLIVTRWLLAWGALRLATCCLKKTRPAWQSFAYPRDLFVLTSKHREGRRLQTGLSPHITSRSVGQTTESDRFREAKSVRVRSSFANEGDRDLKPPAQRLLRLQACSILGNRKQLATGWFTSRGLSSRYSWSGGCFGCRYCERTQNRTAWSMSAIGIFQQLRCPIALCSEDGIHG